MEQKDIEHLVDTGAMLVKGILHNFRDELFGDRPTKSQPSAPEPQPTPSTSPDPQPASSDFDRFAEDLRKLMMTSGTVLDTSPGMAFYHKIDALLRAYGR